MLPIKPSRQMFMGLVAAAVLLFLAMGFGYWTTASKLGKLQAEVAKKQEALANSEQTAQRLDDVQGEYATALAQLSFLEQGVSTKAYVPTLLRQVEDLGKNVNLRVVGVRPLPPEAKPVVPPTTEDGQKAAKPVKKIEPYDKLDIDLEINGKYWDVVSFLYRITSFPKIIAVRSMQVSPVSQCDFGPGSPLLSVKLNTRAFILKDKLRTSPVEPDQAQTPVRST